MRGQKESMTCTAPESASACEIGKYRLVAELAQGGMGNVHLAVAQGPGGFSKLVVVKELKPELCDDPAYVAMFLDEARLAARLIHPNIVQTNEVGSDGHRHYMVMEYLDGRSLHRASKRLGAGLPVGARLRVVAEMLLGLHHVHEMREFDGKPLGMVHRDVSPLNVFVTFAGQAKVLDFGIAKTLDSSLETKKGVIKGRVAYMAPEQAQGAEVDRRADIYSAGVMLWEAAAGRRLWPGMGELEILTRVLRDGPPALRSVCPDAPEELEAICARAMAWQPENRYPTAIDLLHDLEAHLMCRDDTMSMRAIGTLIGQAFADERCKMNAVVDETLLRARGEPRSGVMPTFQAHIVGALTHASVAVDELSNAVTRLFTPSNSFAPNSASFSGSPPATSSTLAPANPSREPRRRVSRRAALWASGVGGVVIGAMTLSAALGGRNHASPPATHATSPAVAGAPAATAPPVEPKLVGLSVLVSPPSAQVSIDGVPAASNPFSARYPRDGQVHHIVASAEGYETKVEDVLFTKDVSVHVGLDRRPNTPYPGAVSVTAATMRPTKRSSLPAALGSDTPAAPPLRPIATRNPYGNP
jgi:serine/threonine protein kinase